VRSKRQIFGSKSRFSEKCQNPQKGLFWHFFYIFKNLSKSRFFKKVPKLPKRHVLTHFKIFKKIEKNQKKV
jgi:hypothetical protein